MFTGGAGTTPPDSKASAALSATTSSATQPETTFRHSTVKRRSIPVRQGHNNSNSESESSCSRIRSRSPQRIRSRKAGSRHTTRTSHSRSATTGTQRKAESSSGRRTIPEKFREVHLKCRDYMAKGQYEKASKAIIDLKREHPWESTKKFGDKHRFSEEDKKSLLELNNMLVVLVIIAKYHQSTPAPKTTRKDLRKDDLTIIKQSMKAPDKWERDLPEDYVNTDWGDIRKSVIFVENHLLNDALHPDTSDKAFTDRLKAAHRYLLWSLNSQVLKNNVHSQWLGCYIKVCRQLLEKDHLSRESAEGQRARKVVELVDRIKSAGNIQKAFRLLKEQHSAALREGFSQDAAVIMACGARVLSEAWLHDRKLNPEEDLIRQHNNMLFYGWTLLAFGPRSYRNDLHNIEQARKVSKHLVSLGQLGFSASQHPEIMRKFTKELINEKNFQLHTAKREISPGLGKYCGTILERNWLRFLEFRAAGDYRQAKSCLNELPNYAKGSHPDNLIDLAYVDCYLQAGQKDKALDKLDGIKTDVGTYAHLEKARLYFAAGQPAGALDLIKNARDSRLNDIFQLAYNQLEDQIISPDRSRRFSSDSSDSSDNDSSDSEQASGHSRKRRATSSDTDSEHTRIKKPRVDDSSAPVSRTDHPVDVPGGPEIDSASVTATPQINVNTVSTQVDTGELLDTKAIQSEMLRSSEALKELQETYSQLTTTHTQVQEELSQLQSKQVQLTTEINTLNTERETLKQRLSHTSKKLKMSQKKYIKLSDQYKSLKTETTRYHEQSRSARQKLNEQIAILTSKQSVHKPATQPESEPYTEMKQRLETELSNSAAQLKQHLQAVQKFKNTEAEQSQKICTLEEQITDLQTKNAEATGEEERLKNRYQQDTDSLRKEIRGRKRRFSKLEEEHYELQKKHESTISTLEKQCEELRENAKVSDESRLKTEQENEKLLVQNSASNLKLLGLKTQNQQLTTQLQSTREQAAQQQKLAQQEQQTLKDQIDQFETKAADQQQQILALEDENSALQEQLQPLKDEFNTLQQRHQNLTDEMTQKTGQLEEKSQKAQAANWALQLTKAELEAKNRGSFEF